MLAPNALTTLETLKTELKLYVIDTEEDDTLTNSGDSLTYSFTNKNLVPGTISLIETIENVTTNIDNLVSSFDYTNGKVTFSSARTGTIKAATYDFVNYNSDPALDKYLERKINAYSDWIEKTLGRRLGYANYKEKYPGNNRQKLVVNEYPIVEINEIQEPIGSTLEITEYEVSDRDKEAGIIFKENGWTYDGYLIGYVGEPTAPKRTILVDYDAGYVLPKDETDDSPRTLPYDLEDFLLNMVAEEYSQFGSKGLTSFEISDVKWQWSTELKQSYQMLLDRYRSRHV